MGHFAIFVLFHQFKTSRISKPKLYQFRFAAIPYGIISELYLNLLQKHNHSLRKTSVLEKKVSINDHGR